MPIIKIWGLDAKPLRELERLTEEIAKAAISVDNIGIESVDFVNVLFPQDCIKVRLKNPLILVEITLDKKTRRLPVVKMALCEKIGELLNKESPYTLIECRVQTLDPQVDGFWTNEP